MRRLFSALYVLFAPAAWALTPDELDARLAEIAPQRASRLGSPPSIPDSERRKAADGQVVTGFLSDGAIYGVGIMNTPIAQLWSALHDETRQYHYTAIAHSELVAGKRCEEGRKVFQYLEIPVPFVSNRWWIGLPEGNARLMRDSGGAVREMIWSSSTDPALVTTESAKALMEGAAPIGSSKGAWFLVALDARTTWAEYHAWSDAGAGIPAGIANRLATGGVRDNFAAMTKFANEGNPSCPIR